MRNHQAKKLLQAMRVGDQALFWASNTKEPGVVGVVEVRHTRQYITAQRSTAQRRTRCCRRRLWRARGGDACSPLHH